MFYNFVKVNGIAIAIAVLFNIIPAKADTPLLLTDMYRMQQEIKTGRELFVRHCTGCHAMDAKGMGPSRAFYTSKPRNLVEGNFKFRSTPLGTLPTREDLLRTLTKGIPPSSMPPFNFLPSSQREAIVSYIQSLRPDWNKLQGETVFIPSVPAKLRKKDTFLASAYNGQKTFQELCVLCHGLEGKGDGPGSQGLFDSDNQPIVPANLNARYLKSGRGARDIFRTITTGLDGTPMPSFGEALNDDKRWELVAFVLYLRGKEAGVYPQDLKLGTGK